jgi:hypothetical protein
MTPQFVRVTDEIHQVGGSGLTAPEDAAIYLIDLDADILCEGHFGIFREKPEITRFIRSFMA